MDQTTLLIVVVAAIVVVAIVAWLLVQRRRTDTLHERFGPEYERTVNEVGDRRRAEAELEARAKRVERLAIQPLSPSDREGFAEAWRATQARFVDDPTAAITEADRLVNQVMRTRGYPMSDFDQRAADISVDHPGVVEHYRAAHDIALRSERGEASTEELRQAMVHYRALFEDLLETGEAERPAGQHTEVRR
jgi:hypothetical protein